jgi:hypothetical protein
VGVNCSVRLNEGAEWKRVGQVACILLGAKARRESLGLPTTDSWHVVVETFDRRQTQERRVAARLLGKEPYEKYEATGTPEYIDILVDGDPKNSVYRAIEDTDAIPYRLWYGLENRSLYPKATAAKIALAEGITKFFGGKIEYNDSTGQKHTFKSPASFIGESDASFYRYQNALEALRPLTQKDIDRCAKYAAY